MRMLIYLFIHLFSLPKFTMSIYCGQGLKKTEMYTTKFETSDDRYFREKD